MSRLASLILLPQTVYQNDGTSQPMLVDGEPVKAAAYYISNKFLQTVSYDLTNFKGTLVIQATLDDDLDNANWFDVTEVEALVDTTENSFLNIEGNFVYVRAVLRNFLNGTVGYVRIAY